MDGVGIFFAVKGLTNFSVFSVFFSVVVGVGLILLLVLELGLY